MRRDAAIGVVYSAAWRFRKRTAWPVPVWRP